MNIPFGMKIVIWMMHLVLAIGFGVVTDLYEYGAVFDLLVEILVGVAL